MADLEFGVRDRVTRTMPRLMLLSLLILVAAACSTDAPPTDTAQPESAETPPQPEPVRIPPPAHTPEEAVDRLHQGIDVSVHSGRVDWDLVVAEGHGFAILKATEGVDLEDGAFEEHWHGAAQAGLVRGAYHFFVTEDDPHAQADFFISKVVLQPGDLAPIVDIELVGRGTEEGWQANVLAFARRLQDHYGVAPIIYTSPTFWKTHFQGEAARDFSGFPLWIAEYDVEEPAVPRDWSTWHMWQFQGDADLQGVEKGADLTRVNRRMENLEETLAALLVPRTTDAAPANPSSH